MPTHHDRHFSPHAPAQLFALVADVDKYPQFLPWCRAARILERGENELTAELLIAFKGFTERYVSRVSLTPPPPDEPGRIDVTLVRGPFRHLENHWVFTPEAGGTRIDFALDFRFRSALLEKLIGSVFTRAQGKMTAAFMERADALYGKVKR